MLILLKFSHKIETDARLPNSFPRSQLIPKPHEDPKKKESYRQISLMSIDTNILNKIV